MSSRTLSTCSAAASVTPCQKASLTLGWFRLIGSSVGDLPLALTFHV